MNPTAKIIAVGGGKGGVGKSVLSTNMAIALALSGQKVILVDADYGASNLHAMLGIGNPKHGFRDFFNGKELTQESTLVDTGISNLKFLSGAGDFPGSADIGSKYQNRVISFIKGLEADVVLMDLGPGTNFHIIDFYNIGNEQVVLSTPEMTSIMNAFSFIKATLFRRISQVFKTNSDVQHLLDVSKNPSSAEDCFEIDQLLKVVEETHPQSVEKVDAIIKDFHPRLILNRVRRTRDIHMGNNLKQLVEKYLKVELKYLGYIIESDQVRDSVEEMIPFLIKDPQSKPSENLQQIVGSLTGTDIHLVKRDGNIFVSKQIKLSSGWGQ